MIKLIFIFQQLKKLVRKSFIQNIIDYILARVSYFTCLITIKYDFNCFKEFFTQAHKHLFIE